MTTPTNRQYPQPADWQHFERLSRALFSEYFGVTFQTHGKSGQRQNGIDIYGNLRGRLIGIQCKGRNIACNATLKISDIDKAIQDADTFQHQLSDFYILTTAQDDAKLQQYAIGVSQQRKLFKKCSVHIFGWGSIEQIIAQCPKAQNSYYPPTRPSLVKSLLFRSALIAILFVTGLASYKFYDHTQQEQKHTNASIAQLDKFIEATDQLRKSYGECLHGFTRSAFMFTYDIKKFCTMPIGEQLTAIQKLYDKLAISLPSRPLSDIASFLPLMREDYRQVLIAQQMTQSYEDDWVHALMTQCNDNSSNVNRDEQFRDSMASAKVALHQQLNAYFLMRDFGVPELHAIKARSMVFAREISSESVPTQIQQDASALGKIIKERQAFQYLPPSAPLSTAQMKQFSSRNLTTSGMIDDIESYRWKDVHIQTLDKVFRGKIGLVEQLIKCKVFKVEARMLAIEN